MEYKSETKQCQNCHNEFIIEPEDFDFYEKMKVPAPTFCPDCRLIRRLVRRNNRALYKRLCDKCKAGILSVYDADSPFTVYCRDCWWGDAWDPMTSGGEYDFSATFFEQFDQLIKKVPALSLLNGGNMVNSDYCNYMSNAKNCYLAIAGRDNENVLYANQCSFSKDSMDIYMSDKLEFCYEDVQCERSYKLCFSQLCENCSDSMFLHDCRNCQNCFGCVGLRNKQYHIFNKPYTKEEYEKLLHSMEVGSYKGLVQSRSRFLDVYYGAPHKYAHLINALRSTGDNLLNVKDCNNCFDITGSGSENCKYTHYAIVSVKDSYDNYGMPQAERVYETIAIGFESNDNSDYYFSYFIKNSARVYYSYNCISCHDVFGCAGLHNKQYCILNKQYTKEEYEQLVPKIVEHMNDKPYVDATEKTYRYGEFFPVDMSPFAYNETIAQEYFPITKEQASEQGYRWKESETRDHQIEIKSENLPDHIKDATDEIVGKIIECAHKGECNEQCTKAFKIIPQESQLYKKLNLPLPRLCHNCRHYQRLEQRNPLKLWHRKCMCDKNHSHHTGICPNEFETSYAPDRPEIVYCEQCYNSEVV